MAKGLLDYLFGCDDEEEEVEEREDSIDDYMACIATAITQHGVKNGNYTISTPKGTRHIVIYGNEITITENI